jgi:hypothetical protein
MRIGGPPQEQFPLSVRRDAPASVGPLTLPSTGSHIDRDGAAALITGVDPEAHVPIAPEPGRDGKDMLALGEAMMYQRANAGWKCALLTITVGGICATITPFVIIKELGLPIYCSLLALMCECIVAFVLLYIASANANISSTLGLTESDLGSHISTLSVESFCYALRNGYGFPVKVAIYKNLHRKLVQDLRSANDTKELPRMVSDRVRNVIKSTDAFDHKVLLCTEAVICQDIQAIRMFQHSTFVPSSEKGLASFFC